MLQSRLQQWQEGVLAAAPSLWDLPRLGEAPEASVSVHPPSSPPPKLYLHRRGLESRYHRRQAPNVGISSYDARKKILKTADLDIPFAADVPAVVSWQPRVRRRPVNAVSLRNLREICIDQL